MTKQETVTLLKLIAGLWNNFTVSDETIASWHFALKKHDFAVISKSLELLVNTKTDGFPPTVPELLQAASKISMPRAELAEETWGSFHTERAQKALELCGGPAWFGTLPDPNYTGNQYHVSELERAKRHYCQVYNSLVDREQQQAVLQAIEGPERQALPEK